MLADSDRTNSLRASLSCVVSARSRVWLALAALLILLGGVATSASAQSVGIQFENGVFKVTGWQAPSAPPANGWGSIFSVYAGAGDMPALLGSYTVEGGALVFHPAYPISPGVHYRAVFHPPNGGAAIEKAFDGPPRPTNPVARVEHIYPSGDVWPSNQLRVYIYFSAPMSRGLAYDYIHMLDENGKEITGMYRVFLPREELWDPGFRRLTMTFDPGRIKTGLTANETVGMPIVDGKRYTLVIDKAWPDARGVPMIEGFKKTFRGGPALRTKPDPSQFRVTAPASGTTDALTVDFPNPMNYALLQRMLRVVWLPGQGSAAGVPCDIRSGTRASDEPAGCTVPGTISTGPAETQWRFKPEHAWTAGKYQIVVDTGLEDVAGNSIEQLFDIDTFKQVTEHITTKTVPVPFRVR